MSGGGKEDLPKRGIEQEAKSVNPLKPHATRLDFCARGFLDALDCGAAVAQHQPHKVVQAVLQRDGGGGGRAAGQAL